MLEWTERFDGPRPDGIRVTAAAIESARVDDDVLAALRSMITAVRTFSEAQRPQDTSVEAAPGIVSERRWLPLDAVGICVPSGRFPLPSSLVMTAVPALVAGVRAHRGRDAQPRRSDARRGARARPGRGVRDRRRPGRRGARVRNGVGRSGRSHRRPGQCLRDGRQAARLHACRDRHPGRPERGRRDCRRDGATPRAAPPTSSPRPSTGATARRSSSATDPALSAAVATLVAQYDNITIETVRFAG